MSTAVQRAFTTDGGRPSPQPFQYLLLINQRLLIYLISSAGSSDVAAWTALSDMRFNASFCVAHKGPRITIPSPPDINFSQNISPVPTELALFSHPDPPPRSCTPSNAPLIFLIFSSKFNYFIKPLLQSASNSACSTVSSSTC